MTRKPNTHAHPFIPDPDLSPDIGGMQACASCHVMGRTGDARHTVPDVPEQAEHRRRIGEKGDA